MRFFSISFTLNLIVFLGFFLQASCGFHAVYEAENQISKKSKSYNEELASIKIEVPRSKLYQDLKNNLGNILNPNDVKIDPKYSINVTLKKTISSTFTTSTGSSGRNKITLNADYSLKDLYSGDVIANGNVSASDDFDVGIKRFANYIAEEAITSNLTNIIARNIRNSLIDDIINNYRQNQ